MKIELKNIQHSPSLSEETEAFTANLYINDVHAGYAKNQGHGGNTDYSPKDETGRKLIKEAEKYCDTLQERASSFDPDNTYPMTLEYLIDELLSKHLDEKELAKMNRQMEKYMVKGVVYGIAGKSFGAITYKIPLTELLAMENGAENLKNTIIKKVLPELTGGNIILNTNIPEAILKAAGLQENQYAKPVETEKRQQAKGKKQGPKL